MKVTKIVVERLKSLPNYENERLAVEVEVGPDDDLDDVVQAATDFVHGHLYGTQPKSNLRLDAG